MVRRIEEMIAKGKGNALISCQFFKKYMEIRFKSKTTLQAQ